MLFAIILCLFLFLSIFDDVIYFILYYFVYRFSGAHIKPTSDKSYDPAMYHQNNIFTTTLRTYENYLFNKQINTPQSALESNVSRLNIENKLITKELECITTNELDKFLSLTNNKRRPLVIKGFLKNSNAYKVWSSDYFKNNYYNTKLLTLDVTKNKNKDKAYTSFNQKLECEYIKLGESIDNMLNSKDKSVYLNNVTEIFSLHPELISDLNLDILKNIDRSINSETWLKVNMFMGGPGTGSSLHCAAGGNFFFNVVGKKRWILIDPKYSKFLRSTPEKNFAFVISGYDIEDPNNFQYLNNIPKCEVILEPGDLLYIPPFFWHYVKNETDFTIGCAIRDHTVYYQSFMNNPIFFLMSPYKFSMNPYILSVVEYFKGRSFLVNESMKSDKYVMESLTGEIK